MLNKISTNHFNPEVIQNTEEAPTLSSVYGNNSIVIDEQRIFDLWKRFSRSLEQSNTHLFSLMQQVPQIRRDILVVKVNSQLQASQISQNSELIDFLRRESGIQTLTIEAIIVKQEEVNENTTNTATVYSSKDKLEKMMASNEYVEQLVHDLDMEVEQ